MLSYTITFVNNKKEKGTDIPFTTEQTFLFNIDIHIIIMYNEDTKKMYLIHQYSASSEA